MIGSTIHNYHVKSLLGEGGMGKVYMATDDLLGRTVAIKNLNAQFTSQPQFLERFKNEAKTLARLSHPNIALLYNYLQNNGDYFMVMEYVEGHNLDQLLKKNSVLPYQVVVPVILQALQGLEHAHRRGILHRDLKPANLMLTPENTVKLMDFGIAKVSDAAKLTQASRVIGTVEFLAPELIEGKEPSIASDIYAMGVTMYELLTGKLPFTGKSDYMLMQDIIKEKPVNLQKLNATVPKPLCDIVMKALEKKPEKRFTTATEFSNVLAHSFPFLKEVDLSFLSPKNEAPATVEQQLKKNRMATVLERTPSPVPTKVVDIGLGKNKWKQNLRDRRVYISTAVALSAIILAFILWPKPLVPVNDDQMQGNPLAVTDNNSDQIHVDPVPLYVNQDSVNQIISSDDNSTVSLDNPELNADKTDKESKVKEEDHSKRPVEKKPQPSKPQVQEDKPQPQPQPKPGEITPEPGISEPVRLRVSVMLALRENLTPETAYEGQSVSFRVVKPVSLRGKTVIPEGSVLHGIIKGIGSKRIALVFQSISVSGGSLTLDRSETGAWKDQVLSKGNIFKASLKGVLNP